MEIPNFAPSHETRQTAADYNPYPGYPTERLVMTDCQDAPTLPEGPWSASRDIPPDATEQARLKQAGYTLDTLGRPLHPHLHDMLSNPDVGVVTGKGKYWHWGPNYTADPVIMTTGENPEVLLIKRSDTGVWALPGGFIEPGESAVEAASREAGEETNLDTTLQPAAKLYEGIVADQRTTAHAWAKTSAYLFYVEAATAVSAADDAIDAGWFCMDNLPDSLSASHAQLIQLACEYSPPQSFAEIIDTVAPELLKIKPVEGGHMAYDHVLVQSPYADFFIKSHDSSRFSDTVREAHSRAYLAKEYRVLQYLQDSGYSCVPKRVELVDDTVLAMEALPPNAGWYWRAPSSPTLRDSYIREVLLAFDQLSAVPLPERALSEIDPTQPTLWREGWGNIDEVRKHVLELKIKQLRAPLTPDFQTTLNDMWADFDNLHRAALSLDRDTPGYFCHHDARQANVAWHPDSGVKLVDWSWADAGPAQADSTAFLIDLAKSGHDTSTYLASHFNHDHALTLIGFWLDHTLWQTRDDSSTIRFQQLASAIAAYKLLSMA